MIRNILKKQFRAITVIAAIFALSSVVHAQAVHTIIATIDTPPSGPNSDVIVNLTMSPADINLIGFGIRIGYDNTKFALDDITDNTGQPGAGAQFAYGTTQTLTGVSYANTYNNVILSTTADLVSPVNIGQIKFRTTASYNDPNNIFEMYLTGYSRFTAGGLSQGEPVNAEIPTDYVPLEPTAGINDWGLY